MKIIFAGTPEFAAPTLKALLGSSHDVIAVYTQPDRPAGRGRHLTASPVKQVAESADIQVYQPKTLKDAEAQQVLNNLQADVMVVAAYGLILPQAVLDMPTYGCINVHGSLLPRWRGAAPIQRAIEAGDKETGITIMQMAAGLDTGDMLHKVSCAIDDCDTAQAVHDKLAVMGADALLTTLGDLDADKLNPEQQNEALATYADKLTKQEGNINWQDSAQNITRKIRAFNPWPVAFTHYHDKVLRVWNAEALTLKNAEQPSTIIEYSKQGLDIASGEGVVRITQLQFPGGKALSVGDLVNAKPEMFKQFSQLSKKK